MAKPNSTRLIELRAKAKRDGWARYIRQGPGEEADERAMLNGCWFEPHRADHWLEFADRFGTLTEGPWAVAAPLWCAYQPKGRQSVRPR